MSVLAVDAASRSLKVREKLSHPIIDCDGHWLEPTPVYLDYLREVGGQSTVDYFVKSRLAGGLNWYRLTEEQRKATRPRRPHQWVYMPDALDRATVSMPSLLHARMDAFGVDFSIVYPTMGLGYGYADKDPDMRRAVCRAHNMMAADMYAEFSDRMTPAAVIPMLTPEEAIEELKFIKNELNLKVAIIHGAIQRPISKYGDEPVPPTYIDTLVMDSVFDYEPLWRTFSELGVAVTTHAGSLGWEDRRSTVSHCFNHVGHFAQANHTFARALFFAGVTYRHPKLTFAFLEGGVGWARLLLNDLENLYQVRSTEALERMRPDNMDGEELIRLCKEYGGRFLSERGEEFLNYLDKNTPGHDPAMNTKRELDVHGGKIVNDFEAAHVTGKKDIDERFAENFYFGCEADDPATAMAFDPRFSTKLKAVYGSDLGHFDVAVLTDVLHEAYELVDDGLLNEDDFKAFTFTNAAELHSRMNPDFFKGTIVEDAVKRDVTGG